MWLGNVKEKQNSEELKIIPNTSPWESPQMPNVPLEITVSYSEEWENKLTEDQINLYVLTKKGISAVLTENKLTMWEIILQCDSGTSKLIGPPEGGQPISVEGSGHSQQEFLQGYTGKCLSEMAEFKDRTLL